MDSVNPSFVLRNFMLEEAIKKAETCKNFSAVTDLLTKAEKPYSSELVEKPLWAFDLCVSCSS